jgi:hypothetical protein
MAKKKITRKKKVSAKKKTGAKKTIKKRSPAKKKIATKKVTVIRGGKSVLKPVRVKSPRVAAAEVRSPMRSSLSGDFGVERQGPRRGMGSAAAGQSGDTEGLSRSEDVDSESVEELLEEGQAFEAEAVSGVENAPDADKGEVTTHEVPEDDVPAEYDEQD